MSLDTMSHGQSVSSQAAERYVLGELTQSEREAFEGHYFDCTVCFEQVKLGSQFMHHAREVLDPVPEKGWLAGMLGDMLRPAPAFVSALFLCAIATGVYQSVEIAGLKTPRVESRYSLAAASDFRGSEMLIKVRRNTQLSLRVQCTYSGEFSSYRGEIVAESGKVLHSIQVPLKATDGSVSITLPASSLAPGKYRVVIQGVGGDGQKQVGSGSFELQLED
jgi:hypothetical protein